MTTPATGRSDAPRYLATFDSLNPERGVVIDQQEDRYCMFPSLGPARDAAARWNQPPLWDYDPPMIWRSVDTGKRLDGDA